MGLVSMRERAELVDGAWNSSTGRCESWCAYGPVLGRRRMPDAIITGPAGGRPRAGAARLPAHLEDEPGIQWSGKRAMATTPWRLRPGSIPRSSSWISRCPSMNARWPRAASSSAPRAAVLILSMHSEPSYVRTCLDAGARGYLLKNAMDLSLSTPSGGWPRRARARPAARIARGAGRGCALADHARTGSVATDRPRKVEQEIARVLGLSANTVAVHRANIMQALDIHNTAELVVYAIRKGLVSIA